MTAYLTTATASDIADTIANIGTILNAVVGLMPYIIALGVAVAVLIFVVGLIKGVLNFVRGTLDFKALMK